MFRSKWLPDLFGRAFAKVPDVPIWQWAQGPPAPFKLRKSPEPTFRANKGPWTKRGADLLRKPWSDGRRIRRLGVKKSSQSFYSESCMLNPIRWTAKYRPRNCIVSLDSQKEVGNMRARLIPTLKDILAVEARFDDTQFKLSLGWMDVWFEGSFSAGGFSNKYAPWIFNDEVDLYGEVGEEGNTLENYWTRAKQADDGFQVVLSKPAEEEGPIDSFHALGNQEVWQVPCPHHGCHELQPFEWDRVIFDQCLEGGTWNLERVLAETFYRCRKCGQPIRDGLDGQKQWMNDRGVWVPTAKGDPEIITQHMSDLYSMAAGSTFGHLAKEWIRAEVKDSRTLRMTFKQQRLGLAWAQKMHKIEESDLLKLRASYRRGIIPVKNCKLAIGMDIGLYTNTRWVVYAFNAAGEMWLIDWGGHAALNVAPATGPAEVIRVMRSKRYHCPESNTTQSISFAFLDARYRGDEVYETCLLAPRQLFPVMGLKGRSMRSISYRQVPGRPDGFGQLNFVNDDAMFDLYVDAIKLGKPPGLHWPENIEEIILREHGAERLIRHKKTNKVIWEDEHKRPNHYGDATKIVRTGVDWLIGGKRSRLITDLEELETERNALVDQFGEELARPA